jgi:hypothetical protein
MKPYIRKSRIGKRILERNSQGRGRCGQFFIRDGDRFGIVQICLSGLGNFLTASIYKRNPEKVFALEELFQRSYSVSNIHKVIAIVRNHFPGKRGRYAL